MYVWKVTDHSYFGGNMTDCSSVRRTVVGSSVTSGNVIKCSDVDGEMREVVVPLVET